MKYFSVAAGVVGVDVKFERIESVVRKRRASAVDSIVIVGLELWTS